jgi:hypothetical protein
MLYTSQVFLVLVSHNHKAVKFSTRSAFLRDEIFGRLLAMGKKG